MYGGDSRPLRLQKLAAMEVVNRLAELFCCEQVGIGFAEGLRSTTSGAIHVAGFDARTQLVRRIEAAMEEAIDQSRQRALRHSTDKSFGYPYPCRVGRTTGKQLAVDAAPARLQWLHRSDNAGTRRRPAVRDQTAAQCRIPRHRDRPTLELKRREACAARKGAKIFWLLRSLVGPTFLELKPRFCLWLCCALLSIVPGPIR